MSASHPTTPPFRTPRRYGYIPGVPVGTAFRSKNDLLKAGVHGQPRKGIHGDPQRGAFSICLSGGYVDNEDSGDKITYVGSGGQRRGTATSSQKQVWHQSPDDPDNKSLCVSSETKLPVRVIRGADKNNDYYNRHAPASGYRYDGLFIVDSWEMRKGMGGFDMCFFELSKMAEQGEVPED